MQPSTVSLLLVIAAAGTAAAQEAPPTHVVKRGELRRTVRVQGELQTAANTRVASQFRGRSTLIYLVPEGSIVAEGQRLAELDVGDLEARRAEQAIAVAKAGAALRQGQRSLQIMESQLRAAEEAAVNRVSKAAMSREAFIGGRPGDTASVSTNREMLKRLEDAAGDRTVVLDNVERALGAANLDREIGEVGRLVLQHSDRVILSRQAHDLARRQLTEAEEKFAAGSIDRLELEAVRIAEQTAVSHKNMAWNDLALLTRHTLRERSVALERDLEAASLALERAKEVSQASSVQQRAELVSAEAEFSLAVERLQNTDQQIKNSVIRAPAAGLVVYAQEPFAGRGRQPVREGMEIRERQEIINLPDVTRMIAHLRVRENDMNLVQVGRKATVRVDAVPDRSFAGKVTQVAAEPDAASRFAARDVKLFKAAVTLDEPNAGRLRPGMNATVEISMEVTDALGVPLRSVHRDAGKTFVWKATPLRPALTEVQLGRTFSDMVEVLAGLKEGDRIYLEPPGGG